MTTDLSTFRSGLPAEALMKAGERRLATRTVGGGDVQYIYQNSNTGFWGIGRDRAPMPEDMELAVNVPSAQIGCVFWQSAKVIDRRMVPYFSDTPMDMAAIAAESPHQVIGENDGWSKCVEIDFADVSGSIEGTIRWNPSSDGGIEAIENVIAETVKRWQMGASENIPIVVRDVQKYVRGGTGNTIHKPILKIVRWVSGPEGSEEKTPENPFD